MLKSMVKPQFQWLLNFQSTTKTSPKNVHERVMHKFNQKKKKKKNKPAYTRKGHNFIGENLWWKFNLNGRSCSWRLQNHWENLRKRLINRVKCRLTYNLTLFSYVQLMGVSGDPLNVQGGSIKIMKRKRGGGVWFKVTNVTVGSEPIWTRK